MQYIVHLLIIMISRQFMHLNIRSMQQMLDYDGDDFQDVFGIAFEV